MRVVQLDFADPTFPVSLIETPDPPLPGPGWARVAVTGGGICGSDIHIFSATTGANEALFGYGTLPMQMGHEVAGVVSEAGPGCPFPEGTRVAVDPLVTCAARGIEPVCDRCAAGLGSCCRQLGSGLVTPGMGLGFTDGLGGGWGDQALAHSSQLHVIPDAVPTLGETLHEPLSIAVHGLLSHPPTAGPVLVVGAGVIGLLAVAAMRALFPALDVVVVAKYPHQADAARRLGARDVVTLPDQGLVEALAPLASTTVKGGGASAILAAGFPYVIEAVGTARAVSDALRCVDARSTLLLLGAAGVSEVDLSPIWFKEATVVGSFCHAHDRLPGAGERHSIDVALDILAGGALDPALLVTHQFALDDYRAAIDTAMGRRDHGAIKVVLRPR